MIPENEMLKTWNGELVSAAAVLEMPAMLQDFSISENWPKLDSECWQASWGRSPRNRYKQTHRHGEWVPIDAIEIPRSIINGFSKNEPF